MMTQRGTWKSTSFTNLHVSIKKVSFMDLLFLQLINVLFRSYFVTYFHWKTSALSQTNVRRSCLVMPPARSSNKLPLKLVVAQTRATTLKLYSRSLSERRHSK